MKPDAAALSAIVAAAERRTAAELVVVLAARADRWSGLRLGIGIACGLVTLAALCWGPWWVSDLSLPGWTAVATALGAVGARFCIPFVPEARRRARVQTAARAAFVSEGVHATAGRVGVLVYVAEQEDVVELVLDVGVAAMVPQETLSRLGLRPDTLAADLESLIDHLAPLFPALEGDQNLLHDAPRVHA